MIKAHKLLNNYRNLSKSGQQNNQYQKQTRSNNGVAFAQTEGSNSKAEALCWKCNKKGHFLAYEKPNNIAVFERLKQQQDNNKGNNNNSQGQAHRQSDSQAQTPKNSSSGIQQLIYRSSEEFDSYNDLDSPYSHLFYQPCMVLDEQQINSNNPFSPTAFLRQEPLLFQHTESITTRPN